MQITQADLALAVGTDKSTISQIELIREVNNPQLDLILADIADFLAIPFNEIFPPDYLYLLNNKQLPKGCTRIIFDRKLDKWILNDISRNTNVNLLGDGTSYIDEIENNIIFPQIMSFVKEHIPKKEMEILELHYGLNGKEVHTFEQIANKLHITKERVRQIEYLAISRLRYSVILKKLTQMR